MLMEKNSENRVCILFLLIRKPNIQAESTIGSILHHLTNRGNIHIALVLFILGGGISVAEVYLPVYIYLQKQLFARKKHSSYRVPMSPPVIS